MSETEDIDDLKKAYELLYDENSKNVKRIAELESEVTRLKVVLSSAATSLETISTKSGRDEYLSDVIAVRSYAASRANVAREAMKGGA